MRRKSHAREMPLGSDVRFIIRTRERERHLPEHPQVRRNAGQAKRKGGQDRGRQGAFPAQFPKSAETSASMRCRGGTASTAYWNRAGSILLSRCRCPTAVRIRPCGRVARKSCACAPVARGCGFGANPPLPSSTMPGRGPTQESPPGNRAHVYNPSQAPMYRQEIKKGLLRLDFRGMGNWATEGIAQAFDVEQCGISRGGNLFSIMLIKKRLGMPECKPFPVSLSMTAGGCIATKPPHRCPRGTDALLFHKGFLFAHQTAQKNTSVVRYPGFPRNFTWFRA